MAIINGNNGNNTLNGTSAADTIDGKGGDDIIRGLAGSDILIGGFGNDDMSGGTGNDIYYVDSFFINPLFSFDRVTELAGGGTDEVRTSVDYTLPDNVENLTVDVVWGLSGTGNVLNNVILGNEGNDLLYGMDANDTLRGMGGNDVLDGGFGNDLMVGGAGNDIYYVGRTGDQVVELGREGTDEVRSYLHNYSLGANVENLTFVGTGTFNGTGNALNNIIQGGNGTNTFVGGGGNDTLRGGLGNDTAIFAGRSTDYTITTVNGVTTVIDNNPTLNGNDGRDTLTGVEHLQFLDRTISQNAPSSVVSMASLDGISGFHLVGVDAGDASGWSVSSAGDLNGDGFDDVIVGAPRAENSAAASNEGESYVVFGKASWTGTPTIDLATLNGANGFRLIGVDEADASGRSVSSAGDVNGDGFDDLIVGAPGVYKDDWAYPGGESYVVFGKASWSATPVIDLGALNGTDGFGLFRNGVFSASGSAVSSAGDVNGDGFDDLIIGSPEVGLDPYGSGASYVVFGKASWAGTPSIDLGVLDGTDGFRLQGSGGISLNGWSVSLAGDVNGDGFDDLIAGAPDTVYGSEPYGEGQSYVVFGKASWAGTPTLDLGTLDGTNGFRLAGTNEFDAAGRAVSSAGDVNGDGFADLIVGAPFAESAGGASGEGESYVVFGKASWAGTPSLNLAALNGTTGFRLIGIDTSDTSGISVASAGDVNGDGFDDVIVGARRAESASGGESNEGESYVVYGKANWAGTPSIDLATLNGTNGFRLSGIDTADYSGSSVSSAGDVNGDGFDDLIVGAPYAESIGGATGEGESYVIFGGNFNGAVTHLGTAGNDTLTGTSAAENFVGGRGNDIFNSGGGADSFQGGDGNDTVRLTGTSFFHIDGGHGTDSIALAGSGLTFDLTTIRPERIESIERIDITGTGNNTLRLSVSDVLDLSDESNSLLVAGNAGDRVIRGAGWTEATSGGNNGDGTSTIGGQVYQHYSAGTARLLVDTDITDLIS